MAKRILQIIYCICFLLLLMIPLSLTNTQSNVKSDLDNRVLVELPQWGTAGYEGKIESYLQDRIGLRDQMVTAYQLLNNFMAGELTHPTYTYGRDGYVFFKMHNNISYGPYHKTFADAVLKMKNYCESRGVAFYFMFDPEKISVYRRYLPAGVNYSDEWVDTLLAYMESLGINCINNKDILMDLSDQEQVFNHQYDAGHWNDLGCFYATNNLWKAMHEDFPGVTEYTQNDFVIGTQTGEYLASSKYPVYETVPSFAVKATWKDFTSRYSALTLHKNYTYFHYFVNDSIESLASPKTLIFHGSYYNRGPKFFAGKLKEYIGIHDYQNVLNLDYYFNIFQPEAVVVEAAEYTFSDRYFDSRKMAELDYNPSLSNGYDSIREAIEAAKYSAKEDRTQSEAGLCLIPHDGFDAVFTEKDLSMAKYVYLLTDDQIFDLQKDEAGRYGTGIPHGAVAQKAVLYYVDYAGNRFYSAVDVRQALSPSVKADSIVYTDGVSYSAAEDRYLFTTDVPNNAFNRVDLLLYDAVTGSYLGPLYMAQSAGSYHGSFIQKNTGWYIIRLKGNTNRQDEKIDMLALLEEGKEYSYTFDVNELARGKIVISNYTLFGPSALNFEKEGRDYITCSAGAAYDADDDRYVFTTDVDGNSFNRVDMQLFDALTGEYIKSIFTAKSAGMYRGSFQADTTGWYMIRLKGNSNKHDESIEVLTLLTGGKACYYSFQVEELSSQRIVIDHYLLLGSKPLCLDEAELAANMELSEGTREIETHDYQMATDLEGNAFNAVILQLRDAENGAFLEPLAAVRNPGIQTGRYYHAASEGVYTLRLRANSNLHDESISADIDLHQDGLYEWSFEVESISPNEITVKNFSFARIGYPYEQ